MPTLLRQEYWHMSLSMTTSAYLSYTSAECQRTDGCRNPGFVQSTVTTCKRRLHKYCQHQQYQSNRKQNFCRIIPTYDSKQIIIYQHSSRNKVTAIAQKLLQTNTLLLIFSK